MPCIAGSCRLAPWLVHRHLSADAWRFRPTRSGPPGTGWTIGAVRSHQIPADVRRRRHRTARLASRTWPTIGIPRYVTKCAVPQALPATRRPRSASAASDARSHEARQPICGSSRLSASRPMRCVRSGPNGLRTMNGSSRLSLPRTRSRSKSMVVASRDACPMLSATPRSPRRANPSASWRPPTLSSRPKTVSVTPPRPTTTSAAPSSASPHPGPGCRPMRRRALRRGQRVARRIGRPRRKRR
jgi:hypothetical protein